MSQLELDKLMEPDYVYFVKWADYIKIGYTTNIVKRMKEVHLALKPEDLNERSDRPKLIKYIEASRRTEANLHEAFSHLRVKGEWFKNDTELRAFIRSIKGKKLKNRSKPKPLPKPLVEEVTDHFRPKYEHFSERGIVFQKPDGCWVANVNQVNDYPDEFWVLFDDDKTRLITMAKKAEEGTLVESDTCTLRRHPKNRETRVGCVIALTQDNGYGNSANNDRDVWSGVWRVTIQKKRSPTGKGKTLGRFKTVTEANSAIEDFYGGYGL